MSKKIAKRLIALLTSAVILVSVMVFQLASAWDEYDSYPSLTADGYYITSEKLYEGDELMTTITYENTFDTNGRLIKVHELVDSQYKGDYETDITYNYIYDNKGRVIEKRKESGGVIDYQYREDGSYIERYVGNDPVYTYDPDEKGYLKGTWFFERDEKGRVIREYTTDDYLFYDHDEALFTYTEDESGKTIKEDWVYKLKGETVQAGVVSYSYSDNGHEEIDRYEKATDYYSFNRDDQVLSLRRVAKDGTVSANWKYTYDEAGNTILIENLLHNYRTEMTYEQYQEDSKPTPVTKLNGIVKGPDGKWAMYKENAIVTSYTGIAKNKYGWWRIENGYVNFNAQGIYKNEYGWWKTKDGKVTFDETGVFKNDYGWWRVEKSKVNFNANSIYKNQYGWWKTTKGKVTFKENGIFQNSYGKWYVKGSKVDFSKNGKVTFNGTTYTIKGGKVVR